MFTFTGYLDRRGYLLAAMLRIGLFIASIFVFPFSLALLVNPKSCGDACGALGLVAAMAYKPFVAYLFIFSMVGVSMRRARDAGLPSWSGLAVPLLLAADKAYLTLYGAPWSLAFSHGMMYPYWPRFVVEALCGITLLCILPSKTQTRGTGNPFGRAGQIALALGIVIVFFDVLSILLRNHDLADFLRPIMAAVRPVWTAVPFIKAAFIVIIIWMAFRPGSTPEQSAQRPLKAGIVHRRLPNAGIAGLAAAIAFAAYVSSIESTTFLYAFQAQFTSIFLPTFALYFALIWSGTRYFHRRTVGSLLFVACAAAPFIHWGYTQWAVSEANAREISDIAKIPTTKLGADVPTVLMLDDSGGDIASARALLTVPQLNRVIWNEGLNASSIKLYEVCKGEPCTHGPFNAPNTVDELPERYLLLKVRRSSSFAQKTQQYTGLGGPYELRLVAPGRDDLIAVSYRILNPHPSFAPVLTNSGWYRGRATIFTEQFRASLTEFLSTALVEASSQSGRYEEVHSR